MPGISLETWTDDPCPRVGITVDGLDPDDPSVVSVWRSTPGGGGRRAVPGWRERRVYEAEYGIDYEAPLGREITYDLEVVSGALVPDTLTASARLDTRYGYLQDPLVPTGAIAVTGGEHGGGGVPTLRAAAFSELTYAVDAELVQVQGASEPVALTGQRMAASGIDISMLTSAAEQGTALRALLTSTPMLLVRPLPAWGDLPDLMYLQARVVEQPVDVAYGGTLVRWLLSGDQARRPALAVLTGLWTYDQVAEIWDGYTYAQQQESAVAAGATYLADARDPTMGA